MHYFCLTLSPYFNILHIEEMSMLTMCKTLTAIGR